VGTRSPRLEPSRRGAHPSIADLEALDPPIDGLIVASPENPSGSMLAPQQLADLARYCEERGIVFDDALPQASACSCSDEAIVVNRFSKYYSMAGWRLGWMVVPDYLVDPIASLAHNLYLCLPVPAQIGALHAIDCRHELDRHVERYRRNRDILLEGLLRLGFDRFSSPDGAFHLYCHVQHMHEDSVGFCIEMLENARVLVAPGSDFCPMSGQHSIRLSYAGASEQIDEAVSRIGRRRTGS